MYLAFMLVNIVVIESMKDMTDALFPALTIVAYLFKIMNFYLNDDGLHRVHKDLMAFGFKNDHEMAMTNKHLKLVYQMCMAFVTTAHITIVLAFLRPLFINNPPALALPSWYPIDWQHVDTYYWIVYTYQMIGAFFILNVNIALDIFALFVMVIASKYVEIVGNRLANLTINDDAALNSTTETGITNELVDCIKVHGIVIRYKFLQFNLEIERLFSQYASQDGQGY